MTEADTTPADAPHEYVRFDTEADFQTAVDRLLAQPGRELRIFDPDLTVLKLNSPPRIALIREFLAASRARRIFIAVHDPDPLTRFCPRMMNLLGLYNHAIQINRTGEEIRELQERLFGLQQDVLRRGFHHVG